MSEWDELIIKCRQCTRCQLSHNKTNTVIGRGSIKAPIILVGEGPGEQEDIQGIPFVGAAGQLLDIVMEALGFEHDDMYISNIVKCHPPANRVPNVNEAEACLPFLREQTKLLKPKIIVCMGSTASKYIIDRNAKISMIRGEWIKRGNCFIMPTFHPAALLRDISKKPLLYLDFKQVKKKLDEIKVGTK